MIPVPVPQVPLRLVPSSAGSRSLFEPVGPEGHGEEELAWAGRTVTWGTHGSVIRRFTVDGEVLHAAWGQVDLPRPSRALFILQPALLTVITPQGHEFAVPLPGTGPQKYIRVLPLLRGALLLGQACPSEGGPAPAVLTHPLEELQGLEAFDSDSLAAPGPHPPTRLTPTDLLGEEILWASPELPLAVTWHKEGSATGGGHVSVWRLRPRADVADRVDWARPQHTPSSRPSPGGTPGSREPGPPGAAPYGGPGMLRPPTLAPPLDPTAALASARGMAAGRTPKKTEPTASTGVAGGTRANVGRRGGSAAAWGLGSAMDDAAGAGRASNTFTGAPDSGRKFPSPKFRTNLFGTPGGQAHGHSPNLHPRASPLGPDPRLSPVPPSRQTQQAAALGAAVLLPAIDDVPVAVRLARLSLPSRPATCHLAADADDSPLVALVLPSTRLMCVVRVTGVDTGAGEWGAEAAFQVPAVTACAVSASRSPNPREAGPDYRAGPDAARKSGNKGGAGGFGFKRQEGNGKGAKGAGLALGSRPPPRDLLVLAPPQQGAGASELVLYEGRYPIAKLVPPPEDPSSDSEQLDIGGQIAGLHVHSPANLGRRAAPVGLDPSAEAALRLGLAAGSAHMDLGTPLRAGGGGAITVGSYPLSSSSLESSPASPSPSPASVDASPDTHMGGGRAAHSPIVGVMGAAARPAIRESGLVGPALADAAGDRVTLLKGGVARRLCVSLRWHSSAAADIATVLRAFLPLPVTHSVIALAQRIARTAAAGGWGPGCLPAAGLGGVAEAASPAYQNMSPAAATPALECWSLGASLLHHLGVGAGGLELLMGGRGAAGTGAAAEALPSLSNPLWERFPVLRGLVPPPAAAPQASQPDRSATPPPPTPPGPLAALVAPHPTPVLSPAAAARTLQALHLLHQAQRAKDTGTADAKVLVSAVLCPLAAALALPAHVSVYLAAGAAVGPEALASTSGPQGGASGGGLASPNVVQSSDIASLRRRLPGDIMALAGACLGPDACAAASGARPAFTDLLGSFLPEAAGLGLAGPGSPPADSLLPPVLLSARRLLGALEELYAGSGALTGGARDAVLRLSRRLAARMARDGWTPAELDTLPPALAVPLLEALEPARINPPPPPQWTPEAYTLVRRAELAAARVGAAGGKGTQSAPFPYSLPITAPAGAGSEAGLSSSGNLGESLQGAAGPAVEIDGMEGLTEGPRNSRRFPRDLRLHEVRDLLRASRPVPLRTGRAAEADPELVQQQQLRLWIMSRRTLALAVGRGAFTLGTADPLPTEPLEVPRLSLAGRLPDLNDATVNLDVGGVLGAAGWGVQQELNTWPEFHNGVAAGLRLRRLNDGGGVGNGPGAPLGPAASANAQLSRSWVLYNRPARPSWPHAGLVLGLGLAGPLAGLGVPDVYDYLRQEHSATTIAVLLGMAAARRGSMDPSVYRTLFLHLPSRHPASFPEVEISSLVQSAAVLGAGLLYQGTCHRPMCEVLLEELTGRPGILNTGGADGGVVGTGGGTVANNRECYALSAGLALGLVTLGRGRSAPGLSDLRLEDRLRALMVGGSDPLAMGGVSTCSPLDKSYSFSSDPSGAVPLPPWDPSGLLSGRRSALAAGAAAAQASWLQGQGPGNGSTHLNLGASALLAGSEGKLEDRNASNPHLVLEGPRVNTDVIGPGATLALALMYLKTNDAEVADRFALPDTRTTLDLVRPDALQLRTMARCLVMWDSVDASDAWLEAQLPEVLSVPLDKILAKVGMHGVSRCDVETQAQARIYAVTGLCLGLGLRFAGSHDPRVERVLRARALELFKLRARAPDSSAGLAACVGRLDKQIIESCLDNILVALSVAMAGSGHLPTLRLLRAASRRLQGGARPAQYLPHQTAIGGVTYGNHLAISMAIGFLFLGGGSMSFSTSNEAIGALVAATYPVLPQTSFDNKFHLQAYRHLYALAAEDRCLRAVDVDAAGAEVSVPVEVELVPSGPGGTEGEVRRLMTPCVLPERHRVTAVRVCGQRYWNLELGKVGAAPTPSSMPPPASPAGATPTELDSLYASLAVPVKRRSGALGYEADPTGVRSLLSGACRPASLDALVGGGTGAGQPQTQQPPAAAAPTLALAPAGPASAPAHGASLVRLASLFSPEPWVGELARSLEAMDASMGRAGGADSPAAAFQRFTRAALHECLARDRPHLAGPLVRLFIDARPGMDDASESEAGERSASLRLLGQFGRGWLAGALRLAGRPEEELEDAGDMSPTGRAMKPDAFRGPPPASFSPGAPWSATKGTPSTAAAGRTPDLSKSMQLFSGTLAAAAADLAGLDPSSSPTALGDGGHEDELEAAVGAQDERDGPKAPESVPGPGVGAELCLLLASSASSSSSRPQPSGTGNGQPSSRFSATSQVAEGDEKTTALVEAAASAVMADAGLVRLLRSLAPHLGGPAASVLLPVAAAVAPAESPSYQADLATRVLHRVGPALGL